MSLRLLLAASTLNQSSGGLYLPERLPSEDEAPRRRWRTAARWALAAGVVALWLL
jgi:hypothetical protein